MIALIVAYTKNKVIGKNGIIPWKIKGEQTRFKELTTGNIVIMGRLSYEEIGKPLPDRTTIVISNSKQYEEENCFTCGSLAEALALAGNKDVYISGGYRLYKEAIDIVDKMYITVIDKEIEGDTYFPDFDETKFTMNIDNVFDADVPYKYLTYTRIKDF